MPLAWEPISPRPRGCIAVRLLLFLCLRPAAPSPTCTRIPPLCSVTSSGAACEVRLQEQERRTCRRCLSALVPAARQLLRPTSPTVPPTPPTQRTSTPSSCTASLSLCLTRWAPGCWQLYLWLLLPSHPLNLSPSRCSSLWGVKPRMVLRGVFRLLGRVGSVPPILLSSLVPTVYPSACHPPIRSEFVALISLHC